jgi:hypothetical protein
VRKLSLLFLVSFASPSLGQMVVADSQRAVSELVTKCNEDHRRSTSDSERKRIQGNCEQEARKLFLSFQIEDWVGTVIERGDPGWGINSQAIIVQTDAGIQLGTVIEPPRSEMADVEPGDVVLISGKLWSVAPPSVDYWPYEDKLFARLSGTTVIMKPAHQPSR